MLSHVSFVGLAVVVLLTGCGSSDGGHQEASPAKLELLRNCNSSGVEAVLEDGVFAILPTGAIPATPDGHCEDVGDGYVEAMGGFAADIEPAAVDGYVHSRLAELGWRLSGAKKATLPDYVCAGRDKDGHRDQVAVTAHFEGADAAVGRRWDFIVMLRRDGPPLTWCG